ncbi:MAG: hypothetical protein LBU70_02625, partial [Chitinispirillales bacterium]|nr:hypothetical protein [Chitinispirillales bacterium]
MKLGRLTLITHFLSILICLQINAQLSTNEIPIGFRYDFGRGAIPTVTMPAVDVAMLKEEVKMWMKKRLYRPVSDTMRLISSALKGHCNYYGVNGNMR